jgi:Flp pilus assembly protein TadD
MDCAAEGEVRLSDPAKRRKLLERWPRQLLDELRSPAQALTFSLCPEYLRGLAYVAAHQSSAAAAEFQKILDHPGVVQNEPTAALAHLGLGRAYALFGDTAKARTAY